MLALVFYKERTIFVDIAYHNFQYLTEGGFAIQNNRFGSAFTQIYPITAQYFGLSLAQILKVYSAGFILYYYSAFTIATRLFKQWRIGLIIMLFSVFMVCDTFFWIQSEFPQGIVFSLLYVAFLLFEEKIAAPWQWHILVHAFFIVTIVFFHPLLVIPFSFYLIYLLFIGRLPLRRSKQIGMSYLLLYVFKSTVLKTSYDNGAMGGLKNFVTQFPDYFSLQSNSDFFSWLFTDYYMLLISIIALTIYYVINRRFFRLALVMGYFFAYLLLINVSYADGSDQFYIENLYLPLSLFLLFPISFELIDHYSYRMTLCIILCIISLRLVHIGMSHKPYTARLDWMRSFLEREDIRDKIILSEEDIPIETLFLTWGSSYEFWLLSTIEYGSTRSIIIDKEPEKYGWTKAFNDQLIMKWNSVAYKDLPPKYFIMNDNISSYKIIELRK